MEYRKYLILVLMIVSAIIVFFMGSYIGTIVAIISLILSIIGLKNKDKLSIISLIGSAIVIIWSIIIFIISFNTVNNTVNNAKQTAMKDQERLIERYCNMYYPNMIENRELHEGQNIITTDILDNYYIEYPKKCDNYVIANIDIQNPSNNTFKSYIKCKDYTTEGFNSNNLK